VAILFIKPVFEEYRLTVWRQAALVDFLSVE
jgi:hypothetical protein